MLVPRTHIIQSFPFFISQFRQAALAESNLLEWRGIVTSLIADPPELETTTRTQSALLLELTKDATATISAVYARAIHQIHAAAFLMISPELCSEVMISASGAFQTTPATDKNTHLMALDLVKQGIASLQNGDALMNAILEAPGFYETHVPKTMTHTLRMLEEDATSLQSTFGRYSAPHEGYGPAHDPTILIKDLGTYFGDLDEYSQGLVETNFLQAIYTEILYAQALSATLKTAYNCLQPTGRFIETYLKDHPEVPKILHACGVILPEGMTPS